MEKKSTSLHEHCFWHHFVLCRVLAGLSTPFSKQLTIMKAAPSGLPPEQSETDPLAPVEALSDCEPSPVVASVPGEPSDADQAPEEAPCDPPPEAPQLRVVPDVECLCIRTDYRKRVTIVLNVLSGEW